MRVYERVVRPVLFRADAERAHEVALRALGAVRFGRPPRAPRTVFGVDFPNPVGLAAGMDKDGRALRAWPALGFGFVEVGTVTWHPQPGNPRPRMVRHPDRGAIVNRMGFNNRGARALAARLRKLGPLPVPLGISLGKSKITPLDAAVDDYVQSLRVLDGLGAYIAVNVSSPNTPGLRALQDRTALDELLTALRAETRTPLLVKVAPDLSESALGELIEVVTARGADGLIATNTTLTDAGGLSGPPLHDRAVAVVTFVRAHTDLPVIGVGGIDSPAAARRMVDAGASLVQLYTGLVYRGPRLVRAVVKELS